MATTEVASRTETSAKEEGRYLYCVAGAGEKVNLGEIGIAGNKVYTVPHEDICAIVHNCSIEPYQSHDQELAKSWVIAHHKVVDTAWKRWGTALPLSFNTIISRDSKSNAEQNIQDWLKQKYETLKRQIARVKGKAEYGVQVFWDPKVLAQTLAATSPEFRKLEEEIKTKSRGLAHMYRQKLENLIKGEMEIKAEEWFNDFYRRIRKNADEIRVDKTKLAEQGLHMLLNLSCLVSEGNYPRLVNELDAINQLEGFSVSLTGPWPPYSFVGIA
ncbi:MAG: GvpL/GvpF family gas vesicle protein [Chloroflexi bacterium]|nr:GvpL/GvpF family gas vesicle protein [Chloroflexota bacterium]